MRKPALLFLLIIFSVFFPTCGEDKKKVGLQKPVEAGPYDTTFIVDTKGYEDNGHFITSWDCPDSRFFPPIDIKDWDKTPVVNGRLPTYKETLNGKSIHHYIGKSSAEVKPCAITLPKLAYITNPSIGKEELVLVIEMVQTSTDTIVGYRYFSGGVGGSVIRDFRFLKDDEINYAVKNYKAPEQSVLIRRLQKC
jgi:hypothetical protein